MADKTVSKSQDKPDSSKKDAGDKKSSGQQQIATFKGGVNIYCAEPLEKYNIGPNKAYKAGSTSNPDEGLFALVCERHLVPRRKAASVYSSIVNPSMVSLLAHGTVYWPLTKQERYIFLYKDSLGKPILASDAPPALGLKQEQAMDAVVRPLVNILQDFRDRDFVHGAIRPANMFDGGAGEQFKKVILGDCLSTPGAYTQPSLYETIERASADPIGRGIGTLTDDLYSFGVSLAVILRTQDPLEGLGPTQVIHEKIKHGSYAAVTGKDRFKGSILELLRGLLHDDPSQRWNIDEVLVWMDGRRLSPKQAVKKKNASRPLTLGGEKYSQASILAMDLGRYTSEVVKSVEDETLEQWLARSLEDEETLMRYESALHATADGGRGSGYEDRLVSNIGFALDSMAPMRFRGAALMGDGIGAALYEKMALKQDVKNFADILLQSVALNWVTTSENPNIDVGGLISKFDSCRGFLRQNKPGYGIERCLYALSPEAPCLSPKLDHHYATTPEDLILAFEDLCEKGNAPAYFLDRHSIAFLSMKEAKAIDLYLYDLNMGEPYKKVMANLKCLASIQKRSKMKNLPHMGLAFQKMLPCVFDRFHDKNTREDVEKKIDKHARNGDLIRMVALLDDTKTTQKDRHAFRLALRDYARLKAEYENLDTRLQNVKTFGRARGRQFAAMVSIVLSVLAIAVTNFLFMSGNSLF